MNLRGNVGGYTQHLQPRLSAKKRTLAKRVAVSAGYTVVELMVTLAISALIFLSAMRLFNGQAGETTFSQTMQDLNAYISARIKEVGTSLSDAYQQYGCQVQGSPPRAVITGSGNDDCVYLGKAFLAPKGSSRLYVYTILGNRLAYKSDGTKAGVASSLEDSNPTTSLSPHLVQTYDIRSSTIKNNKMVAVDGTSLGTRLTGYYTDLSGSGAGNGDNPHLQAKGYTIDVDTVDPTLYDSAVTSCIQKRLSDLDHCIGNGDVALWSLCVSDGSRMAELDVNNSAAGVTTSLKFNLDCSS